MYEYLAKIVSVYDGDTCTALVDLGFRVAIEMPLRLLGINAPEMSEKPAGKDARDHLRAMIDGKQVTSVNAKMVSAGHAVFWDGKGPRPS